MTGTLPIPFSPVPGLLGKLMSTVRPEFRADEFVFDPDDPVFGGALCQVPSCPRTGRGGWGYVQLIMTGGSPRAGPTWTPSLPPPTPGAGRRAAAAGSPAGGCASAMLSPASVRAGRRCRSGWPQCP